jgi:protein DJ-1
MLVSHSDGPRTDFGVKDNFDALIIPGGAKGAETIAGSKDVQALVRAFIDQKKVVGMICAGN